MATIACVMVTAPEVFNLLGDKPVLSRCLNQLEEVRGIDRVIHCASADLKAQLTAFVKGPIHTAPPTGIGPDGNPRSISWAREHVELRQAKQLLLLTPVQPFLPAAKIEACLLGAQKTGVAVLGRPYERGYARNGFVEYTRMHVVLPAVFAFQPVAVVGPKWRSKVEVVPVGSIEALTVSDPEEQRMADALSLYGI